MVYGVIALGLCMGWWFSFAVFLAFTLYALHSTPIAALLLKTPLS